VSILLLLCFLLSTSGFAVYTHYCGDFLVDLSILSPSEGCCAKQADEACTKKEAKKNCCNDETDFFKAEFDLIKPQLAENSFHFFTLGFETIFEEPSRSSITVAKTLKGRAPPLSGPPLYLRLSRLTYYG